MASCFAHVLRFSRTEISNIMPAVIYWIFAVFHNLECPMHPDGSISMIIDSNNHTNPGKVPVILRQWTLYLTFGSRVYWFQSCALFTIAISFSSSHSHPFHCFSYFCACAESPCILQYWTWELYSSKYPFKYTFNVLQSILYASFRLSFTSFATLQDCEIPWKLSFFFLYPPLPFFRKDFKSTRVNIESFIFYFHKMCQVSSH